MCQYARIYHARAGAFALRERIQVLAYKCVSAVRWGEVEEELGRGGGGGAAKKTCLAQGLSTCKEIKEGEEEGFPFKMYLKNGQI